MPNGTVIMMTAALVRLSNCATSTRNTTNSAMAKVMAISREVSSSVCASPRNSRPMPDGKLRVRQRAHLIHCFAQRQRRRQIRVDLDRAALRVAVKLGGDAFPAERDHLDKRNQPVVLRADIEVAEIDARDDRAGGRLKHDRHGLIVDGQFRHLEAVHQYADGAREIGDVDVQVGRALAVDVQRDLRLSRLILHPRVAQAGISVSSLRAKSSAAAAIAG